MNFKELGTKIEILGTFFAFTIQGQHKDKDLTPPMPEPTQQVDWKPEELASLAFGNRRSRKNSLP